MISRLKKGGSSAAPSFKPQPPPAASAPAASAGAPPAPAPASLDAITTELGFEVIDAAYNGIENAQSAAEKMVLSFAAKAEEILPEECCTSEMLESLQTNPHARAGVVVSLICCLVILIGCIASLGIMPLVRSNARLLAQSDTLLHDNTMLRGSVEKFAQANAQLTTTVKQVQELHKGALTKLAAKEKETAAARKKEIKMTASLQEKHAALVTQHNKMAAGLKALLAAPAP